MKSINLKKPLRGIVLLFLLLSGSYELIAQNELQKMVDNIPDGGILSIPEGKYVIDEPLRIDARNGLTLRGDGKCEIFLTDVWKNVMIVSNSNSIRIEGIYLSHLKPLKEYQCNGGVISLINTKKILIDNCELEGSGTIGVSGKSIENLEISHCYIHDNTFNAIYLSNASEVLIKNCVIENNANLIQSYNLDGFEMSDNLIRNNGGYWREKGANPGLKD
tara:strand:+ start:1166 stop:1822 length:657 start_codon:yes stop_codon:yes gene_type:complete